MEKPKKKHDINFLFVLYLIFFVVALFTIIIMHPNFKKYDEENLIDFSDTWVDVNGNEVNLSVINDDMIVLAQIPVLESDSYLNLKVKNINLKIYLDNKLYNDYYKSENVEAYYYKAAGTYFISVPLQSELSGKYIKLEIDSPYKNDNSCKFENICIGDSKEFFNNIIKKHILGFCFCLFIMFLGIIFILISIPLQKLENVGEQNLLYLGFFSFIIGLWSSIETKVPHLIFGHSPFWHIITAFSLLLCIIPIFLFFKDMHKENTNNVILTIIGCVSSVIFVLSLVLHFFRIYDFHETIKLAHLNILIGVIFTLYYSTLRFLKAGFKDASFWGLCSIGLGAFFDVLFYYLDNVDNNSTFTRLGVLGYVCFLGYQIINNYIKNYDKILKNEIINKMAYTDILTNINNRRAFEEEMTDIDSNRNDNNGRFIIVMDLNGLKTINDTYGHSCGDDAIREAANIISESFGKIGKCYRIGGDEFAVISNKNVLKEEINNACDLLKNKIYKRNKFNDTVYNLYIAIGIQKFDLKLTSPSDTFKIADELMYMNKKRIKAAQTSK